MKKLYITFVKGSDGITRCYKLRRTAGRTWNNREIDPTYEWTKAETLCVQSFFIKRREACISRQAWSQSGNVFLSAWEEIHTSLDLSESFVLNAVWILTPRRLKLYNPQHAQNQLHVVHLI